MQSLTNCSQADWASHPVVFWTQVKAPSAFSRYLSGLGFPPQIEGKVVPMVWANDKLLPSDPKQSRAHSG
jgi:hypothetical protein